MAGPNRPRRALWWLAVVAIASTPVAAQEVRRGTSPLDLPRPGLEPRVRRVGPAELRLQVDTSALYDTNVYATSRNGDDDVVFHLRPRADIDWEGASTTLHGEAYADVRRHVDITRENAATFGAAVSGDLRPSGPHRVAGEFRYDRAVQSRTDPEARAPITVAPRKIDIFTGELGYTFRGQGVQVAVTPAYQRFNYLDPDERDRNMNVYRASSRITYRPAAPVAFFAEPFVNRRDFVRDTDFNGINRDTTTYGVLIGASRELSARLTGSIGVGVFRAEPDDATLTGFTGFAANGRVTWTPRVRTAITATVFRGDVATVRAGANGRTDTQASLRVDQEARHNLLLFGSVGYLRSQFRGPAGISQSTIQAQAGAEFLLTRSLALFGNVAAANRDADRPLDRFSRGAAELGVRVRF